MWRLSTRSWPTRRRPWSFGWGRTRLWWGAPPGKLSLKPNLLVACINRYGRIITPRGKDAIEIGDTVIIVTTNTGLKDLKDILR